MDDFASTALYNLIAERLRQAGLNAEASNRFAGKTERTKKTDLLSFGLATLGPAAIVDIGQGVRVMDANPTVSVLLDADAPGELLARWQRLERYYHGRHRVRILHSEACAISLEHYSTHATPPSVGEDLVIAGLMAALLQRVGCRSLSLSIGGPTTCFIDKDKIVNVENVPEETAKWHIEWQAFEIQRSEICPTNSCGSTTDQLSQLFSGDLGRNWRLAEAAMHLSMSTRSLQRVLAREGTSFQQLLRTVRAVRSAELISSNRFKLAEVGYTCGFADQAHFSRDFKIRFNMSPSQFAEIAATS